MKELLLKIGVQQDILDSVLKDYNNDVKVTKKRAAEARKASVELGKLYKEFRTLSLTA